MADLRLLVVADDPLARTGLAALLNDQSTFDIVGQLSGDDSLAARFEVYRPDVILWDLGWEADESLSLLDELMGDEISIPPVVALVPNEEVAAAAWLAGARGLLFRNATAEQLIAAAVAGVNDLVSMDPELLAAMVPTGVGPGPALEEELTPRETEVLQLLAEGYSNKAIAQQLAISEHTVKFHVNAIMSKLGAESRTAAVVQATRLGLILL